MIGPRICRRMTDAGTASRRSGKA